MNLFHHSRAFIEKHKRHHHVALATLALVIAGFGVYIYRHEFAQAATFTFNQTSWAGGLTANTATHASNQSGWTQYSATSTNMVASGSGVSLGAASYAFTDDGATSTTPSASTTGGGYSNGTFSSTVQTGTSTAASVQLVGNGGTFSATGGTITTAGGYTYNTFTSSGTFQVTAGSANLDYLVVAGGGGGGGGSAGYGYAGGGGAGGMVTGTEASAIQSYTVVVGAGGAGDSTGIGFVGGSNGSDSTFGSHTATGGGGGATGGGGALGKNGGSGGGGVAYSGASTGGGTGVAGQGNSGNAGTYGVSPYRNGGSGGGAGGVGSQGAPVNGNTNSGGPGASWVNGVTYAAGACGAGAGACIAGTAPGVSGVANTGSGGGGSPVGGGNGGSGVVIVRYLTPVPYASSGTFTSAVINTGAKSNFTTLAYATTLNGQTITMDVRAGDVATPDGTWTAWTTNVTNGGSVAGLGAHQYVQYRANLSTTNPAVTPTLDSVTINYSQYAPTGNLTSSKYDTGVPTNTFAKVLWNATTPAGTGVQFQVRTASTSVLLDTASWCGPTNCSGTDYFTTSNQAISNTALTDSVNDQWLQYKVLLTSSGDTSPTLTSASLQYVQNAAPSVTNLSAVSQASDGTVTATYDVSDDTNTSVTVSLQYCTTNCTSGSEVWVTANTVTGAVGLTPVGTSKTITWTPATDYPTQYNGAQKIRIMANDGEAANNLGYSSASNTFILDTIPPSVTIATFDSTQDAVNLTATDNSALSYRLCNAACSTEAWTAIATQGAQSPISWTTAIGAPGAENVYLQVKDAYGNVTARTLTAPATPGSFLVADVSNPGAGTYGETLSWVAPTGATSYNVYYATTSAPTVIPPAYAPLVMGVVSNVYAHIITTATTSAYWYKVSAVGASGVSNFAVQTPGDVPDSFGTARTDTVPPVVQSVATSSILSTSAVVTVVTDKLASIQIFYSPGPYAAGCLYTARTSPSAIYATSTVVALTGLSSSTTYNFCVKATSVAGYASAGTSGTENSSFTTVSGPGMVGASTFTVTSNTATINWTTSTTSDSYVTYGTPAFGTNNKRIGVSTYTTTTDGSGNYVHAITLTGLTAGTDYYYQVESSNALGTTIDTNTGAYYHLKTTIDITPPVIVGAITTPVLAPNAAVIVWQTDEPSTSQVLWGTASSTYTRSTINDTTKSIYHVVTLSASTNDTTSLPQDLAPQTTYHFAVKSSDMVNPPANMMTSSDQSFTTPSTGNVTVTTVNVVNTASAGDTKKDTTPPSISNVTVEGITPFGATVKFGTDKDSDAFVEYGKDTSYGDSAGDKTFGTTHTIKLHGLVLGTDYHIMVTAHDKAGNTGTSADQTFKTTFLSENLKDVANVENIEQFQKEIESAIESILPSLVPPFVTKPVISDITESGATVTFKTNIKAFPVVVYAEAGAYDETKDNPYTGEVSDTVTKDTTHSLKLTGLKGNTKYHIQARAFSLPKVIGKSADVTFITKASKIAGSIVERKKDSFTVVWTTEEPTTSIVEFKNLKTGITERKVDDAMKKSHSMKIENLPSGTAYEVNLSGLTEQGNIAEAGSPLSVTTSTDTTPPTISGFKVDNALVPGRTDRIQTIVSWMTDEPANATVYYEEGAGTAGDTKELANKVESLDSYTANHSIILPNLKPGTIYRLKVTSSDDSGNLGSFGPRTVITPQQAASITDIIFKNFEDSFKFLRKI